MATIVTGEGGNAVKGVIFNIQTFSTEDGPGLRTTAFFKGCPLRCAWCHNPEGLSPKPQLIWHAARCIGCGECLLSCPNSALTRRPEGVVIDRRKCRACGTCAGVCPAAALEVVGRVISADWLAAELARDVEFYRSSGGGVTFSGGECLAQPEFYLATAGLLRAAGIHVALDTSGFAPSPVFDRAVEACDLVLFDLKLIDPDRHRRATGVDNRLILENARRLAASGRPFWVRFPVIPGYTDDDENVRAVSEFISREMPGAERVDFLAYNNLCESDYQRLDMPYPLAGRGLLSRADMDRVLAVAREAGLDPVPGGALAVDASGGGRPPSAADDRKLNGGTLQ
mgnify:FL=1